ncbi:MAG: dihydropteroate synthase [Rhizobiaceae bacterium]|nr:dihydropteroate synthase [Rhizobiaceae bacterium]MCV0407396.1 dihydropteroate synthase [Rhizobiaceae bacterium]
MTDRIWKLAHGRDIALGSRAVIMGVVNVTPDSFSDGGRHLDPARAVDHAKRMIGEGASIIDLGGESTRPGGDAVGAEEEQRRVLPVIARLAAETDVLISVDTYRSETARRAIDAGAHIVNDVWGLQRDPQIAGLAAARGAGLVIMHNGRDRFRLDDQIDDQAAFLGRSLEIADAAGVPRERIVLDPGFGFAKDVDDNLALIARFAELHRFGLPLLAGVSRKRFLGHVTGRTEAAERDVATAAANVALRLRGADIFRVHDVAIHRDALAVADAIVAAGIAARNRACT